MPSAVGLLPQLAALETIIYPSSQTILANHALAQQGTLEIAPMEAPLTLFVWSTNRIVPVRIDRIQHHRGILRYQPQSDPRQGVAGHCACCRSTTSPGRIAAPALYMVYQQQKEALARRAPSVALATLGSRGRAGQWRMSGPTAIPDDTALLALLQPLGLADASLSHRTAATTASRPTTTTLSDGRPSPVCAPRVPQPVAFRHAANRDHTRRRSHRPAGGAVSRRPARYSGGSATPTARCGPRN